MQYRHRRLGRRKRLSVVKHTQVGGLGSAFNYTCTIGQVHLLVVYNSERFYDSHTYNSNMNNVCKSSLQEKSCDLGI